MGRLGPDEIIFTEKKLRDLFAKMETDRYLCICNYESKWKGIKFS